MSFLRLSRNLANEAQNDFPALFSWGDARSCDYMPQALLDKELPTGSATVKELLPPIATSDIHISR